MVVFLVLTGMLQEAKGQPGGLQRETDSLRLVELYEEARMMHDTGDSYQALNTLGEALQLAMQLKMEQLEVSVLELIGDVYMSEGNGEEAIPYYIRVGSMLEFTGDSTHMQRIYRKTGDAYAASEVHEKALEYYLKAESLKNAGGRLERIELVEKSGTAALHSGRSDEAMDFLSAV